MNPLSLKQYRTYIVEYWFNANKISFTFVDLLGK